MASGKLSVNYDVRVEEPRVTLVCTVAPSLGPFVLGRLLTVASLRFHTLSFAVVLAFLLEAYGQMKLLEHVPTDLEPPSGNAGPGASSATDAARTASTASSLSPNIADGISFPLFSRAAAADSSAGLYSLSSWLGSFSSSDGGVDASDHRVRAETKSAEEEAETSDGGTSTETRAGGAGRSAAGPAADASAGFDDGEERPRSRVPYEDDTGPDDEESQATLRMFDNLGRLEPVDDGEPSPGFSRFISQSIFGAPSSSSRRLQAEQDSADKKHTVRDLLRSKAVEEYPLLIAAVMFFAAFFEEVAKVLALLVGFARVKEEIKATPTCCCCASFGLGDCRGYIIRRWEAFVFYGICVGFGFMLTENVKYFTMIGLSPDIGFKRSDAEDQTWWMRRFLAVVRNVFNLHPILTGCSAARYLYRII